MFASQTMIFLSEPPLMRTSKPEMRVQRRALTKSEWPVNLRRSWPVERSHDQMDLSQDPA